LHGRGTEQWKAVEKEGQVAYISDFRGEQENKKREKKNRDWNNGCCVGVKRKRDEGSGHHASG